MSETMLKGLGGSHEFDTAFDPFEVAEPDHAGQSIRSDAAPVGAEPERRSTLNYYSYYSEIEAEFIRRRRSHIHVSSLDWALIQTWKENNVPLHIVIRGINQAFDGYDKRPVNTRKV